MSEERKPPSAAPRDPGIDPERLASYHRFTRERGVSWPLYLLARALLQPALLIYFRLSRTGREHTKVKGPLIVAANHRSFLDPFVIAICLPWLRPLHFVAKVELFEPRWQGWLLNRLGAYPVRRGKADEDVLVTSRQVLERGGVVCIFPEGTRIRSGSLGRPRRGFGRLALETGAAVLPVTVQGSEHCRRGWRVRPRKVKVRAGRALTFPHTENPSPQLANSVGARVWPAIELQWEWLGGLPPLRKAAVIGAGSWGTAVAVLLARGGLEVQLGTRSPEQAESMAETRENAKYLPGVYLPKGLIVKRAHEIELAGCDLICLAGPSAALPSAVGAIGDRVGQRAAVLLLAKGLVAPMGALPNEYVQERIRSRAIACLGGPAHAQEACGGTAALVLGSEDLDLRTQLGEVFDEAGLVCERSDDVCGVEVAGAAKNAAALAAATAESAGMNAAGIATAEVWRECLEWAKTLGARPDTFTGLAGIGDLTATILAPQSRNRQAGELLGKGTPAAKIPAVIGQASEGLDSVPLIAEAVTKAGIEAPALQGLAALIDGEIDAAEWLARLRRVERARRAA
ncbi:MAG: 1-acyl-sn-glycerol-3-phosphate acyltransferase [Solirubrobacterales bacterium]